MGVRHFVKNSSVFFKTKSLLANNLPCSVELKLHVEKYVVEGSDFPQDEIKLSLPSPRFWWRCYANALEV